MKNDVDNMTPGPGIIAEGHGAGAPLRASTEGPPEGDGGDKWSLPLVRLGDLGPDTVIAEAGLAELFGKCRTSIKRAVQRGELPAPVKMFGQPCWTAGALAAHIRARLERAAKDAQRLAARPIR